MKPIVTSLHRKPAHKVEMEPVEVLRVVAGKGISGDVSFGRSMRQILLVSDEVLQEFNIMPGQVRENILTRGIDVDALQSGTRILVGNTRMEITGPCSPCSLMDEIQMGLQAALEGRRGVLATALSDGVISVGDPIEVIQP